MMSPFSVASIVLISAVLVLGILRAIKPNPLASKSFITGCVASGLLIIGFFDLNARDSFIFKGDYGRLNWVFIIPLAVLIAIICFTVSNIKAKS